MEADKDRDGKISFEEFTKMVENTDVSMSMTLGKFEGWKPLVTHITIKSTPFLQPHPQLGYCLFDKQINSERIESSPDSHLFGNERAYYQRYPPLQ